MKARMKRIATLMLAAVMAVSVTACGGGNSNSGSSGGSTGGSTGGSSDGGQVEISLYTTIPGKDANFEEMVADFMNDNPDIKVNYIAYDSSEKQKWMTLYSGGEAPTVSIMDAIDILDNVDNMLAFDANDEVLQGIDSNYTDVFSVDGNVYGVPDAVQAMGILYNKTTIENATGEAFDPANIKTRGDLEALCEKIQAGGVAPLMLTGVDWSLGSHFLSQIYTGIRGGAADQQAFCDALKNGEVDLINDASFNEVFDTFDLFAKYNYNAKDALVGNTDIDGQAMAKGEVAMWFMGDWGWSYLSGIANDSDEYGIMSVPLTGSSDAINQQLGVFPAKGFCVDKSQSSPEQQEAGKKLIKYIMKDDAQKMADLLETALPYSDVNVNYVSPMISSVQSYVGANSTYSTFAFSSLLPSDHWSENGAVMQQYLVGQIDRAKAAELIENYWKNHK